MQPNLWGKLILKSHKLKKLVNISVLVIIILLTSFCEKEVTEEPSYADFERSIRDKYDVCAVFQWSQYAKFLEKLKDDRFVVLPLNEMRNYYDSTKIVVGLRHDVDLNIYKAVEMSRMESIYGVRSTYFLLATADYYGHFDGSTLVRFPGIKKLIHDLSSNGAEIGIHNDLFTVMIKYNCDPLDFNTQELEFYKSINIPVTGSASHGGEIAKQLRYPCYNIFSDYATSNSIEYNGLKYPIGRNSLSDYGFEYEAYHIPYNVYYSDSGGKWNDPKGFEGILNDLDTCKAGDRVQILVHPDWWGKL